MDRYDNIGILKTSIGQEYLRPVFYPNVEESSEDIYVIATDGDRYDKLSMNFYGSPEYWWVIAVANQLSVSDSLFIAPGTQLRIPENPEDYTRQYQDFNLR